MTKRLHIGAGLSLPLDAVTETIAILAKRGSGKTYTASVEAEELLKAGMPIGVLDPTGAWWGLRSSADGKGEGFPITILGGDHADVPLDEAAGKDVADIMVNERVPLVLDLSTMSKAAMRRFVADFAERIYQKNREPLHLIIDEADAFAPQRPRPDEMRMLGAIDDIVRRGRIRGLGVTLVTQRSAVLNKDVLTQAEVLIALRTPHPKDRAPILEWMKVHATPEQLHQVEETLASLDIGEAWIMSAGWLDLFKRVRIRKRETFNSSATPKPGEKRIEPRKLAEVDLAALQKRFATAIEQAKAEDPKTLKKQLADARAELEKLRKAKAPQAKVEIREVYVLKEGQLKRLEKAVEKLDAIRDRMAQAQQVVVGETDQLRQALQRIQGGGQPPPGVARALPSHQPAVASTFRPVAARQVPAPPTGPPPAPGEISAYARSLVDTIARRHPMALTRAQISTLSGRSPRSSSFDGAISALLKAGILVKDRELYLLSEAGLQLAGAVVGQPQSAEEVRVQWRRALPAYEALFFDTLGRAYPQGLTREQLAEQTGKSITSSSFDGAISSLRKNGLVTVERGEVRASDTLFEVTRG